VRQRAVEAVRDDPSATNARLAKVLKCSPATIFNARRDLAKEQRKKARKAARTSTTAARPADRRERAQQWLRDRLADGPQG